MQTPVCGDNLPGLPAIAYRTGTWATFKSSMLARLSSADYPALAALKTRDDDDFSIALLDASSVMLDILTFYQERLANESYLRTATQLPSLTELARLIGYQPAPGVGSSVYLSFTLQAAPGAPPDPSATAITIPKGTQVQSVPAQGQTPQTFETSADILAKADWSALPVQTGVPWKPKTGDLSAYLQGTATQLQPGDAILIVGDERLSRTQHRPALGPPHRHGRGNGYRSQAHVRHLERAVGRCRGERRAREQESGVLRAAAARVAVRLQRGESADANGGHAHRARRVAEQQQERMEIRHDGGRHGSRHRESRRPRRDVLEAHRGRMAGARRPGRESVSLAFRRHYPVSHQVGDVA